MTKIEPLHIMIKTISRENRERIFQAIREKHQIIHYQGEHITIATDFLTDTLRGRKVWNEVF
jgi:hypothetical protein